MGPTRLCMCAIVLCSIWPTTSGSMRNAPSTTRQRKMTSKMSSIGGLPSPILGIGNPWRTHAAPARRVCGIGVGLPRLLRTGPGLGDPCGEDEFLAEWVAFEAVGQQQRIEFVAEVDAEHLMRFALMPGGAGKDLSERRDARIVARDQRCDEQVVGEPWVSEFGEVDDDAEPVGMFVDGGQPVEVGVPMIAQVRHRFLSLIHISEPTRPY